MTGMQNKSRSSNTQIAQIIIAEAAPITAREDLLSATITNMARINRFDVERVLKVREMSLLISRACTGNMEVELAIRAMVKRAATSFPAQMTHEVAGEVGRSLQEGERMSHGCSASHNCTRREERQILLKKVRIRCCLADAAISLINEAQASTMVAAHDLLQGIEQNFKITCCLAHVNSSNSTFLTREKTIYIGRSQPLQFVPSQIKPK